MIPSPPVNGSSPGHQSDVSPSIDLQRDRRDDVFVVERPWGQFQQFVTDQHATVKTMLVKPGHRLSLQWHRARSEMWQVVHGPVLVTVGEETWEAQVGELIWIPQGTLHRLEGMSDKEGLVLEVAFGQFDEDDIVRIEDDYSRS